MYSVYEIICLDRGSTPLTSTLPLRSVQSEQQPRHVVKLSNSVCVLEHGFVSEKRGQPRHVVKLPTRACLVLTDRGDKYVKHYTINQTTM